MRRRSLNSKRSRMERSDPNFTIPYDAPSAYELADSSYSPLILGKYLDARCKQRACTHADADGICSQSQLRLEKSPCRRYRCCSLVSLPTVPALLVYVSKDFGTPVSMTAPVLNAITPCSKK